MNLKKMKKEVDEICASLEKPLPDLGPALQVENLEGKYRHLFSEKTKEKLGNIVKELDPQMNQMLGNNEYVRVRCKTIFFSYHVRKEENMDKACEKLISVINDLVDRGFVYGFLAPLGKIRLFSENLTDLPHAVFIFPHLTKKGAKYVKANKPESFTEEGCVGPEV